MKMMGFLHLHGGVPQPRIAAALRVHENTVRAAVRRHRLKGDSGSYTPTTVRIPVVNPALRTLDGECRTLRGKIAVENGRLADLTLEFKDMELGRMEKWIEKESGIAGMIADIKNTLDEIRTTRRKNRNITFDELPAEQKFERLNPTRKLALDTVRMIAYRAETAISAMAGTELSSPEDARSMVKAMFNTTVNLHPNTGCKKLRVVLHPLAETRLNKMAEAMLVHLNETKFIYPGTELQMVYEMLTPIQSSG